MKDSLYELIDRKYLKEVRYLPKNRELSIDIQNKDVIISFYNTEHYCILMTVKMDNKQNRDIYNIIKNELLNIHKPYQEYVKVVEDKENDKNIHSLFAISIKRDLFCEEVCSVEEKYMHCLLMFDELYKKQKEYMNYLLDVTFDFDKNVYQEALQTIEENKELYIIVHGEGEKEYEIFI